MNAQRPVRRVVTIGPECTGKTTLAIELAHRFDVPYSLEYARIFVDQHPRAVLFDDVDAIGRGQRDLEERALDRARALGLPLVMHDTDLVSTVVYSRHYYGECPGWIPAEARARLADLYLLHDIDVPWIDDGFQRAAPERREALMAEFVSTLQSLGANVVLIRGPWAERTATAEAAVASILTPE